MKEIVWSTTMGYILFHIEEIIVPDETQRTDIFLMSRIFISFDLTVSTTFSRSRGMVGDMLSTGILVQDGRMGSPHVIKHVITSCHSL
jgi:hypothetical protein